MARRYGRVIEDGLSLREQLREDWERHGRLWTKPGLHAVVVQRLGTWTVQRMKTAPAVLSPLYRVLWIVYRVLFVLVRNLYGIELPVSTKIGRRFRIDHQHGVTVHHASVIGNDCEIHQGVTLGASTPGSGGPRLGNRVRIGAYATVLGQVQVGNDVRIGPHALVISDVPDGSVVFPQPTRMLRLGNGDESGRS